MELFKRFVSCVTSVMLVFTTLGLDACSSKGGGTGEAAGTSQPASAAQPAPPAGQAPADQGAQQMELPAVTLSADGLDELLAPIALYPDPVLAVMLQAAQDPQEVMDGGNWLAIDQNANLKEAALDQASSKAGFTPVMQALLHYGPVVDMMCTQFDWTKQLGAAYKADPKAVLASVQRLRAQAVDNGALKSSPQMKVNVTQDQGQQVVEIAPADPKVVYVPAYDPSQVYTTTTTTMPDGTTTTTTTGPAPVASSTTVVQQQAPQQESSGVSTGTAVLIGLLSFGAGMAVGAAINNNNYYYPAWGYGGVYYGGRPYYAPPYRPVYYGGWHGGYGYNRPVHYGNNNIYINNTHNYYNRFNGNNNMKPGYKPRPVPYNNRPGSVSSKNMGNQANARRGVTATARPATVNNNGNFRGQSTYQGANRGGAGNNAAQRPAGGAQAGNNMQRPAGGTGAANNMQRPAGGAQAGNNMQRPAAGTAANNMQRPAAGGNANAGNRATPAIGNRATTMPASPGNRGGGDRGFGQSGNAAATRPAGGGGQQARPAQQPSRQLAQQQRPQSQPGGAFGGSSDAKVDRQASSRGQQSMGAAKSSGGGQARSQGGGRKR